MRFGAMLWMQAGTDLGKLTYKAKSAELHLELPERARALYGEVAEARLGRWPARLRRAIRELFLKSISA